MANFQPILKATFTFEGGYQADPADNANYNSQKELVGTNRGISALAMETYLKRPPTISDMKSITPDLAAKIYKMNYWDQVQGDKLKNQSVAHACFDSIIAHGFTGVGLIRQAYNKTVGKQAIAPSNRSLTSSEADLINKADQKSFFFNLKDIRVAFEKEHVQKHPEKQKFLKGWLARLDKITFTQGEAVGFSLGVIAGIGLLILAIKIQTNVI
jgi:lysozyme family protein